MKNHRSIYISAHKLKIFDRNENVLGEVLKSISQNGYGCSVKVFWLEHFYVNFFSLILCWIIDWVSLRES